MIIRNKYTGETREVPDTQVGRLGITGSQTQEQPDLNSVASESLLGRFLSNPTGKNASNLLTGYNALKPEVSADEKKRKMQRSDVEKILAQVESAYFGGKNVLSYSTPGNKISGVSAVASALLTGSNPDISAYLGLRDNLRPTLARAAGDVGNLSGPEQNRAVALIPTPIDTPEEAIKKLNTFRSKLGLPEKDYSKSITLDKLPLPEQQKYYSGKKIFKETVSPTQGTTVPTTDMAPTQDTKQVGIPNLPYGVAGSTIGGLVKNPAYATLIGGTGNWLDQLKQKGIPLTREAQQRDWGLPASLETAGAGLKTGATSAVLHPIKTLGLFRNLSSAGKVADVSNIFNKEQILSKARPEQVKMWEKLLNIDTQKYANAKNVPLKDLINEVTSRGAGAYSKGQDLKSTAAAGYNAITRDLFKKAISDVSPTTGNLTSIMGKINTGKNLIGKFASKYLPWIATASYLGDRLKQ